MPDRLLIEIQDAPATLRLGVGEAERASPQQVLISFALEVRSTPDDALEATIDYDLLIDFLRGPLDELGPFKLIETVAGHCAGFALSLREDVMAVEVTVKKPSVLGSTGGLVQVRLRRERGAT